MAEEQKKRPIGFLSSFAIIGFAMVIDLFQAIADFVLPPLFGVTFGAIAATAVGIVTLGFGAVHGFVAGNSFGLMMGLVVAHIFSLFLDVIAVTVLSLVFWLLGSKLKRKISFKKKLAMGMILEIIPFFNLLPGWTLTATLTIMEANGLSLTAIIKKMASSSLGGTAAVAALKKIAPKDPREQEPANENFPQNKQEDDQRPAQQRSAPIRFDGIRSANDNTSMRSPSSKAA